MWGVFAPGTLRAWLERRRVLRDLRVMQAEEINLLAADDNNILQRAKSSLAAGDRVTALQYWTEARRQYPEFVKTSHDTLEVLTGLQLWDEAETIMSDGCKHFPKEVYYARGFAQVATERRDHSEAAQRWAMVRQNFPNCWEGHARGATSLKELGRLDEAEAVLIRAIKLFGREVHCQLEFGRLADLRKDWDESLRRWTQVEQELGHPAGVVGAARALREMGRLDEAQEKLTAAQLRHPQDYGIVVELAHVAQQRGNKIAEIEYWETVLRRFPMTQHGYYSYARRLAEMGKTDEQDAILLRAVERFPREVRPAIEYAVVAHDRQDWPEAERRWQALREAWPDCHDGYRRGIQVLHALKRDEEGVRLQKEYKRRFNR